MLSKKFSQINSNGPIISVTLNLNKRVEEYKLMISFSKAFLPSQWQSKGVSKVQSMSKKV
jgi:hypothetical protein